MSETRQVFNPLTGKFDLIRKDEIAQNTEAATFEFATMGFRSVTADEAGGNETLTEGNTTNQTWHPRLINTLYSSVDVSAWLNQEPDGFTLQQNGLYLIDYMAIAYRSDAHITRIYNVTDGSDISADLGGYGTWGQADSAETVQTASVGRAYITISGDNFKKYRLETYTFIGTTNGLGYNGNLGMEGFNIPGFFNKIDIQKLS